MNEINKTTGINWLLRLKNKTTLLSLLSAIAVFVYTVLGLFGITPSITQSMVNDLIVALVQMLVMLGIVVDPTTQGVTDSKEALGYSEPKRD